MVYFYGMTSEKENIKANSVVEPETGFICRFLNNFVLSIDSNRNVLYIYNKKLKIYNRRWTT